MSIPRACIRRGPDCSNGGIAVPGTSRCVAHGGKAWHHKQTPGRYGAAWQSTRTVVLQRDPMCTLRLVGCTGQSQEVDHIIRPDHGGSDLPENCRGVCRHCHRKRTAKQGVEARRRKRDR